MTRTTMLGLGGLGAGALIVAIPQLRKLAGKHPGYAFGIGVALAGATVLGLQQTFVYDAQSGEFSAGEPPPVDTTAIAVDDTSSSE
jgi:hypothetical protein